MKILISAYACSPYHGSEPGTGWGFVHLAAKENKVYVITEKNEFESDICSYLDMHPELKEKINFFFIPRIRFEVFEKFWPPSYYWTYRVWQKKALKLAEELHHEIGFDMVHQLNLTGFREPGYLWKLDVPFVWGPIGGTGLFPWRFLTRLGFGGAIHFSAYNLINIFQKRFLLRPKLAASKADRGLITDNSKSQKDILKYWGRESTVLCAVGIAGDPLPEIKNRLDGKAFKIVWSGLHEPRKALNLGLEAVSLLPRDIPWELHILGEGSCTFSWKRLAGKLKVTERCFFHGQLSRKKAVDIMGNSHVMLITSLKDDSSTVAVEALGLDLPIVCLDHCGFSDIVTPECGIKVTVAGPKKSIEGMAQALTILAKNESLRQSLAKGSLSRAKNYSWQAKESVLDAIYQSKLRG